MKNQLLLGAIAFGSLALTSAINAAQVSAMTLRSCTDDGGVGVLSGADLTDNVTNTGACQYIDPPTNQTNDQGNGPNVINVNNIGGAGFHGYTDWNRESSYFDSGYGNTVSLDLDDLAGGTDWWKTFEDVMLVFKDGNNTSTLTGYLYTGTDGSFAMTDNIWGELYGKDKGISHVSVYTRGTAKPPTDVPTPAAVLPILGGLFGAASRRKKGESTEA